MSADVMRRCVVFAICYLAEVSRGERLLSAEQEERRQKTGAVKLWSILFQLLDTLAAPALPPPPSEGWWEELELRASCPECAKDLRVERLRLPGGDRLRLPPHAHPRPDHCGQSCAGGALTLTLMPDLSDATNNALEGRC